ncbi:iron-containing alcohol dehydrogenase [Pseudodesulfovibrio cashew]|uniref:Iron-containing alcohol dehydrogenase n=1 Tax=Pseudodesulfovibrio cashew TaxID=2678688 RepID=A0A6I6JBV8_9BACT|nr:iron-containing alcohol dehydrogenase [Pseudodesulfovibrio cashew]QGY38638.1 iron-containing alcohol dehydrogenase [Pseudodesulfovibrio cashew]
MSVTYFQSPSRLVTGAGAVAHAGPEAARFGSKALVVTGRSSSKKSGALDKVVESLESAGVTPVLFNQVPSDPDVPTVENGAAMARTEGCDVIVALGGGSPLDAAKGISLLLGNPGRIVDYEFKQPEKAGPPIVAIPTTAGTGSEITRFTVITDTERTVKMLIQGPGLIPTVSILDPELTYTMPADFTAATGMDALTHAMEAYLSTLGTPLTDIHALAAIELIAEALVPATLNGANAEAREKMLLGQMEAGYAFGNASVGLVHAMSRPLGAHFGIPHGKANAMLLAPVMEYNRAAAPERFVRLAKALGENVEGLSVREAGYAAVETLYTLFEETGLPAKLGEYGVTEADLDKLTEDAAASGSCAFNPRVPDKDAIRTIYAAIL